MSEFVSEFVLWLLCCCCCSCCCLCSFISGMIFLLRFGISKFGFSWLLVSSSCHWLSLVFSLVFNVEMNTSFGVGFLFIFGIWWFLIPATPCLWLLFLLVSSNVFNDGRNNVSCMFFLFIFVIWWSLVAAPCHWLALASSIILLLGSGMIVYAFNLQNKMC